VRRIRLKHPRRTISDVPVRDAAKTACPLQCRLRHGPLSRDHVDWAGLPTNLDLAFSQAQCDKVYAQHLLRKRQAQLRRWLPRGEQVCVCDATAGAVEDLHAARNYVTS
jgi:hypothetical protein